VEISLDGKPKMARANPPQIAPEAWTALLLYSSGHACIGYLLAIPIVPAQATILVYCTIGILTLAWAGAIAGTGAKRLSFLMAVVGAYLLAGGLGWAVSLIGFKGSGAMTLVVMIWGAAWVVARSEEEEAWMLMAVLVVLGLIAGATNSAILAAGILFTFVVCTSPAIGEQFGSQLSARSTFSLLVSAAGWGIALGWAIRRIFWG
jgi:hypothetical protein